MKITVLGTGTSQGVPVISCDCAVCTSTNPKDSRLRVSILIETNNKSIVIDSGPDFRYQMLRAGVKDLDAIVFTHEHKDHVAGLDDIRPFNYLQKKIIDVYATERVQFALKREFAYIFDESTYFGLPKINLHAITADENFEIGSVKFIPIEALHFKLPVLGFRIANFTYLTDIKTISKSSISKIKGTEILIVNALQRTEHVSHLTLNEAIDFAKQIGARQTYFTHISHYMGLHDAVNEELPPGMELAYDGLVINL